MGRSTSGVGGIRLGEGDELLAMMVASDDDYCVTVTDGGYAKRTQISEWNPKGRNIRGVRAMKLVSDRGGLVGALVCQEGDEVLAIADSGVVIRSPLSDIRVTGRDTMGVSLMGLGEGQEVVAVARAAEMAEAEETGEADESDESEVTEGTASNAEGTETSDPAPVESPGDDADSVE